MKLLRSTSVSGVRIPLVRKDCSSVGRAAGTKKPSFDYYPSFRSLAQLGRALRLGRRCRRFESCNSDHCIVYDTLKCVLIVSGYNHSSPARQGITEIHILKKTFIAAALALATLTATAAGPGLTVFSTYDYDKAEAAKWSSDHTLKAGLKLKTSLGTFDAAAVGAQRVTNKRADSYGAEVGYSLGVDLKGLVITGRAAYGEVEKAKYYSMGVEATQQVTPVFGVFGGYRHTNGVSAVTPSAVNRYTVGVDMTLTKALSVRLGYARAALLNENTNGVTTAVSYSF